MKVKRQGDANVYIHFFPITLGGELHPAVQRGLVFNAPDSDLQSIAVVTLQTFIVEKRWTRGAIT